jgi:hypothetical protein
MDEQAVAAVQMLSTTATSQCYKACVAHPDVKLAPAERNCMLRCTDRFIESVRVVMGAMESYVVPYF